MTEDQVIGMVPEHVTGNMREIGEDQSLDAFTGSRRRAPEQFTAECTDAGNTGVIWIHLQHLRNLFPGMTPEQWVDFLVGVVRPWCLVSL
jgi:hypothetical protein